MKTRYSFVLFFWSLIFNFTSNLIKVFYIWFGIFTFRYLTRQDTSNLILLFKLFFFPFLLFLLFYAFALFITFLILFIHFSGFLQSFRFRTHWKWNWLTFYHFRFNSVLCFISRWTLFFFPFVNILFRSIFIILRLILRWNILSNFWRFYLVIIFHFCYFLNILLIFFSDFLVFCFWLFLFFRAILIRFVLRYDLLLTFLFRIIANEY